MTDTNTTPDAQQRNPERNVKFLNSFLGWIFAWLALLTSVAANEILRHLPAHTPLAPTTLIPFTVPDVIGASHDQLMTLIHVGFFIHLGLLILAGVFFMRGIFPRHWTQGMLMSLCYAALGLALALIMQHH